MQQLELLVPDRFDMLQRRAPDQLNSIVVPVAEALDRIDSVQRDTAAAGRGGFLLLRGESGSGKSTFLHTLGLFREGVDVASIPREAGIADVLRSLRATSRAMRLLVVEGREALRDVAISDLEAAIHEINSFIRQREGERTLIVWPCNAQDLQDRMLEVCGRVGADALLGVGEPVLEFSGPTKDQYLDIADRTLATLNEGASLIDLGVSSGRVLELRDRAGTIGQFMGLIRQDLLANQAKVRGLLSRERCRVWIVVAAGTEPDGDVAALTRGRFSAVDIDRLMAATGANVVQELKKYPEKIGILGAVLDARILHLPMLAALGVARELASPELRELMRQKGLSINKTGEPLDRLLESDLGRAFKQVSLGPRARGPKPGSNTQDAFLKLASIAATNDRPINETIAEGLRRLDLIEEFQAECDLGKGLTRRTDILCQTESGPVRLEMMWRARTGRAEIANYVLTKLQNYGRAIEFLA